MILSSKVDFIGAFFKRLNARKLDVFYLQKKIQNLPVIFSVIGN